MSLSTYLFFDGDCAEAFDFYKSVFGGEFQSISTWAEAPSDMPVDEADKGKVMHVSLPIGDSVLMGADSVRGMGAPPTAGDNFAIAFEPPSREEADRVFPRLAEGGETVMPLQETFWGSYFGQCTDRFGVQWMVNLPLEAVRRPEGPSR